MHERWYFYMNKVGRGARKCMSNYPRLEKGDTIHAYVKGDYCKVSCYGMMKDGRAKVYVIHPDGTVDRMLYEDGNLCYNPVKNQRRKRDT